MTNAPTFVPSPDVAALQAMVDDAKASTLRLARHMLGELEAATVELVTASQSQGWRLALEVSADAHSQVQIAMTLVSPDGLARRSVADVAEGVALASAH